MEIFSPIKSSTFRFAFSGSDRFLFPPAGIAKPPPPKPRTRPVKLAKVTLPPDLTTSLKIVNIFHDSSVTSFVVMDAGSRTQLSQIPQVVIFPPDAASASGLSQAAAESCVLVEKY